ncbi:MAG TPA: peptidyl-prolyl cis-trans isomerase, partial [Armatimonadetes bacterium]|nr:peptidyl-prolyl cis-trans isomerase [Armatimonadota bacterium]
FRTDVRNKRGLLGTLPLYPEILNERLVQAIAKLSVGQYSKPIRLDSIWTIVWMEKRIPADKVTYKAIRSYVQLMFVNAQTPSLTDIMDELRRTARVQVHAKEYKAVEALYGESQRRRTTPQATQRGQGK